jgi:hypothetical protein
MKNFFSVIVVIPVGPKCRPEFVEDTINSFTHYARTDYKIVLADDSHKNTGLLIQQKYADIDVVPTPSPMGKLCGLYITLSLAYRHVLDHYHFDALLRMDTDALVIGPAPEKEAIQLFKSCPDIGIAGQYPFTYSGEPWDISWPKNQITKYTSSYKFFRRPLANTLLWMYYRKALQNGYRTGESVFGGVCFVSEPFIQNLYERGLLPNFRLKSINLEEDHLFALLAKSAGFKFGNLSSAQLPFGCAWQGLPAPPHELIERGKKIIHSVRYWKDMNEEDIRSYFREKRNQHVNNYSLSGISA